MYSVKLISLLLVLASTSAWAGDCERRANKHGLKSSHGHKVKQAAIKAPVLKAKKKAKPPVMAKSKGRGGKTPSAPAPKSPAPAPKSPAPAPAKAPAAAPVSAPASSGNGMKLVKGYNGTAFLDTTQWYYFDTADPTHGLVQFLGASDAQQAGLAKVDSTGNFIMAVDSTTSLAHGQNRKSVRLTSAETITQGQLVIMDATHMPVGCSTWPAWWLVGSNWPNGGEVDIIEGVQGSKTNQMTVHSTSGCTLQQPMQASGKVVGTNCDVSATSNESCGVQNSDASSWGAAFNAQNGGVYATYWAPDGWTIWFWPRNSIPADVKAGSPNPSGWGQPAAKWAQSSCAAHYFSPMSMVWDITLCGDWAGAVAGQGDGCPSDCASSVMNPATFKEAYWSVSYVRVYQ